MDTPSSTSTLPRAWARLSHRGAALARRAVAALEVWVSRDSNPFLERALRIEARKQKPMLTVLGVALCVVLAVCGGWYAWDVWTDTLTGGAPSWRVLRLLGSLQRALGDNPIRLAAMLAAAACGYSALRAVRVRSSYLLRQEVLKGTLHQLQLLPIAEERWLWLMTAHLTALALLVGAVGLPVYMLAISTGQWSVTDLLGLALVFLMLGHVLPAWQPQLWKQAAARGAPKKPNVKQWRETLKQARGDLDPMVQAGPLTDAQRLEAQRRTQRALAGGGLEPAANAEPEAPATGAPPTLKIGRRRQSSFGGGRADNNFGSIIGWFGMWMLFNTVMTGLRFGGGAWGGALRSFWGGLPRGITDLGPAIPITWPLLVARLLTTPLSFFALALPPVLLVLPCWVLVQQQRATALGAMVSSQETYWTPRRARRRAVLRQAGWGLGLLLFWGYGWHALVADGNLGGLLPGAPLTTDWALAAAWTVTTVVAAFAAGSRIENAFARAYTGTITLRAATAAAGTGAARMLATALAVYFGGCWLGGVTGITPAWQTRLLPTTATLAAFLCADFGIFLLSATLTGNGRKAVRTVYWIWWVGLAAEAAALIFYGAIRSIPFSFEQAPHVVLSPIVTVLALFRFQLSRPGTLWWWGPLAQVAIGAGCGGAAGYIQLSRAVSTGALHELAAPQRGHWSDPLLAPLLAAARLAQSILVRLVGIIERADQWLRRVNEALVRAANRSENPVLQAEMRRRAQREHWSLQLLLLLAGELVLFFFIADPGSLAGRSWQGSMPPANLGQWGQHVVAGVLVPSLFVIALTTFGIGQTFDRERANGTLLFLYLTPMTDASILWGKLMPGLLYGALLLTTALPWLFVGCAAGIFGGMPETALTTAFGLAYLLSMWVYIAFASIFFAIRSTKPTQGGAEAFLWVIGLEGLTIGAIVWAPAMFTARGIADYDFYTVFATVATILTVLHCLLAAGAWQLALYVLRRQRYGDVLEKRPGLWRLILDRRALTRRLPATSTSAQ